MGMKMKLTLAKAKGLASKVSLEASLDARLSFLYGSGWGLSTSGSYITFDGPNAMQVSAKIAAPWSKVITGQVSSVMMTVVREVLSNLIQKAWGYAQNKVEGPEIPPQSEVGPIIDQTPKTVAKPDLIFPVAEMETAKMSTLQTATRLYEPVKGTSAGSRYFVVAISDWGVLAARFLSPKASFRVEPKIGVTLTSAMAESLKQAGLGLASKGHWSMHLTVVEGGGTEKYKQMCSRLLGSVMYSLDWSDALPKPSISLLVGKGM